MMDAFHDAFTLDRETGLLFWRKPPPEHAEKAGCPEEASAAYRAARKEAFGEYA